MARDPTRADPDRHHLSRHDPLTRLPNRLLLQERLEHVARGAPRSPSTVAVLVAHLDHLASIVDTFGHQMGDHLLRAVAHRLRGLVRPGDTLARCADHELVLLCEHLTRAADVGGLARRVDRALAEPFHVAGVGLGVSATSASRSLVRASTSRRSSWRAPGRPWTG